MRDKERVVENVKRWREKNKEQYRKYLREYYRAWRAKNRKSYNAYLRNYRVENLERTRANKKAYRAANREKINARRRELYMIKNGGLVRPYKRRSGNSGESGHII